MDPNAALEEALRRVRLLIEDYDVPETNDRHVNDLLDAGRELAERMAALDGWIRNGGFLPKRWVR